jgi:hypothetical protein
LWRRKVEDGSSDNRTEGITIIALVTEVLDLGIPANEIKRVTFYQTQMEKSTEASARAPQRPIIGVSMVDTFQGDEK